VKDHHGLEVIQKFAVNNPENIIYLRRMILNQNLKTRWFRLLKTETWSDLNNAIGTEN
jgi:hypothetical protein